MNLQEQQAHFKQLEEKVFQLTQSPDYVLGLLEEMKGLMLKKGNDYSTLDRLGVFKTMSSLNNIHLAKTTLLMMAVKINRMANLLDQGVGPENESLQDTSIDLCCYSFLNHMALNEP